MARTLLDVPPMRIALGLATVLLGACVGDATTDEASQAVDGKKGDTFVLGGRDAKKSAPIDRHNAFFASLGTNGRDCETCHDASAGWTITPAFAQARFAATHGTDPLFRTNDGSVSPLADVSTEQARRDAYALLLSKGLIRVGIGIPAGAEFRLAAVDDPYGYASAAELSLFRRPLPSTNTAFLSAVMWDGRESTDPHALDHDLTQQASDATFGHAQATVANSGKMLEIAAFEQSLFTAVSEDDGGAGKLDGKGAHGGAATLAGQDFFIGINDPLGGNPTGAAFNNHVFDLFDAWAPPSNPSNKREDQRRYAIYRGQQVFNTKSFTISGVKGLNDKLGVPAITGTCSLCHDAPNVGNHSVPLALDLGLTDASHRTPDLPLYTLERLSDGARIQTTDPGRALITGKWDDIGKFKGPVLRGAALRAPYFHNGSAATLRDVVDLYDGRFQIGLTPQEADDLVAFLESI